MFAKYKVLVKFVSPLGNANIGDILVLTNDEAKELGDKIVKIKDYYRSDNIKHTIEK